MTVKELIKALQTFSPDLFVDITEVIDIYDKSYDDWYDDWYENGEQSGKPPVLVHRITNERIVF